MDLLLSHPRPQKGVSVEAAVLGYLQDCEARKLSEKTLKSYKRTLEQFAQFTRLGHPIAAVQVEHVAAFRSRRDVASATQRKEIEQLRFFFAFCVDRGYAVANPASKVKLPKDDSEPTLPFTREEITSLLMACDEIDDSNFGEADFGRVRARALVLLLSYSGLRISDAAGLKRSALTANRLLLRQAKPVCRFTFHFMKMHGKLWSNFPPANILLLWGDAMAKGYAAPIWMTYKQAQEVGGQVRKGEQGSLVVYANSITKTDTNEQGEDIEREIPFMKGYTVFNVEQVDGLPAHYYAQPENPLPLSERIENADQFVTNTAATIHHGFHPLRLSRTRNVIMA